MSYVRIGNLGAVRGEITLPRVGAWWADLDFAGDAELPEGKVTLELGGALELVGTVHSAAHYVGLTRVRVVAGADGLRKVARPQHFVRPVVRTILSHLAAGAGEALSPTIGGETLNQSLPAWTVQGVSTGAQIETLVAAALGTSWRFNPDGTLWVGAETWPDSEVSGWREMGRDSREGRIDLGLDSPTLLPGTLLDGEKLDSIEHRFDERSFRATAWLATEGDRADRLQAGIHAVTRGAFPTFDYRALYRAKVVKQSGDRQFVDLQPELPQLPGMSAVPLELGIPGASVAIPPGGFVHVTWKGGDPALPVAFSFEFGAKLNTLSIEGKVELGGKDLQPLLEQIVIGKTPCQYTGAPHHVAGGLSTKGFAKG